MSNRKSGDVSVSVIGLTGFVMAVFAGVVYNPYDIPGSLAMSSAKHSGQGQERTIEHKPWPNTPVDIVVIKSKGKDLSPNSKFEEGDDWLNGLTLRVKNVSDKIVVYIEADLEFPRRANSATSQEPPLLIALHYGVEESSTGQQASNATNQIKPGGTVEIPFSDEMHDDTKVLLNGEHYPSSIKHIKVLINTVIFDDGIIWHAGGLMRRDPNKPSHWIPIRDPSQGRVPAHNFNREASTFQRIC